MPLLRRTKTELIKALSRDEVQQHVIRLPTAAFLPPADLLFDVWHDGVPWAAKIRSEPCSCPRPPGPHRHRYIEGGELHAGLHWRVGSRLRFRWLDGRVVVDGDLQA